MIKPTEAGEDEWTHGEIWLFGLLLMFISAVLYGTYIALTAYTGIIVTTIRGLLVIAGFLIGIYLCGYIMLFALYNVGAWLEDEE